MLWIILFFIIILISAVLAFRSMKDYEEFPDSVGLNGLFYIGNPAALSEAVLSRLDNIFSESNQFFSLEKLIKGNEKALAFFGPVEVENLIPELKLVEIEDYLADPAETLVNSDKTVTVNQSLTWLIDPKSKIKIEEEPKFSLNPDQKLFFQTVNVPEPKGDGFQSTVRVMVVDPNPSERVILAKKIAGEMEKVMGLKKLNDTYPEQKKFTSFQQRSLIPKEVASFSLTINQLLQLASVN